MQKKLRAFTLVELIVVIVILGILSTIGFVSYNGYLGGARDSNRISQLKGITDSLNLYAAKNSNPLPEDYVTVTASGTTIGYQGYAGVNTLELINYTNGGQDPKDDTYFTYYLSSDRKQVQLLTFLEETDGLQTAHNSERLLSSGTGFRIIDKTNTFGGFGFSSEGQTLSLVGVPQTYAADYTNRFPKVYGKKLGVLTQQTTNTPIQDLNLPSSTLDVATTTSTYNSYFTDSDTVTGTGSTLAYLKDGGAKSCKEMLQRDSSKKGKDGTYTINPNGILSIQVYCDMTTDGGGWTLGGISNGTLNGSEILTNASLGDITNYNSGTSAKLSTSIINNILSLGQRELLVTDMNNNTLWFIEYLDENQLLDFENTGSYKIRITNSQGQSSPIYDSHEDFRNFTGISTGGYISSICPSGCRHVFSVYNNSTGLLGVAGSGPWTPFMRHSGGFNAAQLLTYKLLLR